MNEILQVIKSFKPNGRTIEEKHYKSRTAKNNKNCQSPNDIQSKYIINMEIKNKLNSVLLTYSKIN